MRRVTCASQQGRQVVMKLGGGGGGQGRHSALMDGQMGG